MTPFEQYIKIIEFWKVNRPTFESNRNPGWQGHHSVPESFQKIDDEFKHEITKKLESLYRLDETVLVPDRVHFELHMLLVEIYPKRSQEWFKMSWSLGWFLGKRQNRFNITSEEYEKMKAVNYEAQKNKEVSKETRQKLSKAKKGIKLLKKQKPWSEDAKQRASERNLIVQNRPDVKQHQHEIQLGKKRTDETRAKMCIAQSINQKRPEVKAKKSGANHTSARAIEQWTKDGIFVARYEAMVDAQAATGVRLSGMYACCHGRYTHSGGFIWKYAS